MPTATDSAFWSSWVFDDGNGNLGQTYVQRQTTAIYTALDAIYAGLHGFVSTYTIVSHASDTASVQNVNAGVYQQVQLASIPIFQFAMYSSGDMEISCGQPFDVTGRVHSNKSLYVEPDNALTFESGVTAVVSNLFSREPLDPRGPPAGTVVYVHPELKVSPVAALTLPIGASNTPTAIREIIEPPPAGESPSSAMGRLRYFNQCDMIVFVSNAGVVVSNGDLQQLFGHRPDQRSAVVHLHQQQFFDAREGKTVRPIDINVGQLATWSRTNSNLRLSLLGSNLTSVYVVDSRTLPATSLSAVRVYNGKQLPPSGLTVATGRPLYVLGRLQPDQQRRTSGLEHFDHFAGFAGGRCRFGFVGCLDRCEQQQRGRLPRGGLDDRKRRPADRRGGDNGQRLQRRHGKFPALSGNVGLGERLHLQRLDGENVSEPLCHKRLEHNDNIYDPPARNWAFDMNFNDPTKLPPKTPSLLKVIRSQWATLVPGQNTPPAAP